MERVVIKQFHNAMMEFQQKNAEFAKDKCVTNVQYLYDCVTKSLEDDDIVKAQAIICCGLLSEKDLMINASHMVLIMKSPLNEEVIIDPSYETCVLQHRVYLKNIAEAKKYISGLNICKEDPFNKEKIESFLHLVKLANKINDKDYDLPVITDMSYYNAQADYIEQRLKKYAAKKKIDSSSCIFCSRVIIRSISICNPTIIFEFPCLCYSWFIMMIIRHICYCT